MLIAAGSRCQEPSVPSKHFRLLALGASRERQLRIRQHKAQGTSAPEKRVRAPARAKVCADDPMTALARNLDHRRGNQHEPARPQHEHRGHEHLVPGFPRGLEAGGEALGKQRRIAAASHKPIASPRPAISARNTQAAGQRTVPAATNRTPAIAAIHTAVW
jgi:hypothetical protein